MRVFVRLVVGGLVGCGVVVGGCESRLNAVPIEDNIQQTFLESRRLLVEVACPKDRKTKGDAFTCEVTLPDGTALEATVEVSEQGEVAWTIDLQSRAYVEATLKQSIAQRKLPEPLVPKTLSCPDITTPDQPIACEVIWPNGQKGQVEVSFQHNLPTWRAPLSLRMYDTPSALVADLTTRAHTIGQLPVKDLACGGADTLLIQAPLRCRAVLVDASNLTKEQDLSVVLGDGGGLQFAPAP